MQRLVEKNKVLDFKVLHVMNLMWIGAFIKHIHLYYFGESLCQSFGGREFGKSAFSIMTHHESVTY